MPQNLAFAGANGGRRATRAGFAAGTGLPQYGTSSEDKIIQLAGLKVKIRFGRGCGGLPLVDIVLYSPGKACFDPGPFRELFSSLTGRR